MNGRLSRHQQSQAQRSLASQVAHRRKPVYTKSTIALASHPVTTHLFTGLGVDVSSSGEELPENCSSIVEEIAQDIGIDGEQAAWFAQYRPELMCRPTVRLKKRLSGLAVLLGCSVKQSASMAQKQPALLDLDSDDIKRKLSQLAKALGDDRRRACSVARRMPACLLSSDTAHLSDQMDNLVVTLGLSSTEEAMLLAYKEPMLLVMQPDELQLRLQGIAVCLDLSSTMQTAMAVCRSHPWMLTVSSTSLRSKIQAIMSALQLSRIVVLQMVLSYPSILSQSEMSISKKVTALTAVVPRQTLQCILCRQPSLLMRSCEKVLQSFRAVQETTGLSTQDTVNLVERRPGVLGQSPASPARSYRALSIWKLSNEEKREILKAHPLLLHLSPREVHFRCRWLRQLIGSNGYYHSAARRLPPSLLGIAILHLPSTWSRLQYLAESNKEGQLQLTDVLQMRSSAFDAHFPEYKKWLHYKTSEMGCKVPWRQVVAKRAPRQRRHYGHVISLAPGDLSSSGGDSLPSWHDAGSVWEPGPYHQTVVSEASLVYYGIEPVRKPRRVVLTSGTGPESTPVSNGNSDVSASDHVPESEGIADKSARQTVERLAVKEKEMLQNCIQLLEGDNWEPGSVS